MAYDDSPGNEKVDVNKMFVLILGLSLSLASAQPSHMSSCSSESCWRVPDYLLTDIETVSENTSKERALVTLLCHLDCLERGEEVDLYCYLDATVLFIITEVE